MHTRVRYWGNREFWVAYELVAVLTGDSHGLSPHRSLVVVTFLAVLSRQTGLGTNSCGLPPQISGYRDVTHSIIMAHWPWD